MRKILLIALLFATALILHRYGLADLLTLENLKSQQQALRAFYAAHPAQTVGAYFALYVALTALSFPGATVLTLAGGAFFGFTQGLLIVSFASTLGATAAFLASRTLLRDWIRGRFGAKLAPIDEGIRREGAFYLFTLRLLPLFPFFLVNLAMGLTPIRTFTYFWVSQLGMLPGTAVYVNAGTQLSQIDSLRDVLSAELLLSFALIGLLPFLCKGALGYLKSGRVYRPFRKPKKFEYNLVVIGGGSAGLVSAYIAATVKAKVALIEKHKMGGDCLNTGCVPSKALIRSAKILSYLRRAEEFGLKSGQPPSADFALVMDRVRRVITKIEPHDSTARYRALGVDCIEAEARIRSPYEIQIGGRTLTTRNIIIATGARPFVPPIPGLNQTPHLTSDTVWGLKQLPNRLLVLGGGPIGCELAQSFARLGAKVTLVEMGPRLMMREDPDVSDLILRKFQNEGIDVLCNHRAVEFDPLKKTLLCKTSTSASAQADREVRVAFDEVLVALGRKANISGFGLEELYRQSGATQGVETSPSGTIAHDAFLRTRFPNIYVCGDVAGPYQFTHTAAHQAWYAAVNALFSPLKKFKADYRVIPWCTFTDPEVARVGMNETEAKEKNIAYEVSRYGIDDLDRAITEDEDHGFIKVLTEPGKDRILGVTIVGPHAGDTIAEYVTAMKYGLGLNKILGTIHIYPTFSESNKYVAGAWKKAHAPQSVLRMVEKFHSWRRR